MTRGTEKERGQARLPHPETMRVAELLSTLKGLQDEYISKFLSFYPVVVNKSF